MHTRYFLLRLLTLALVVFVTPLAMPQDAIGETTRQIVEGRELVQGYVTDIHRAYAPGAPEYIEARKRYRVALSKYNGWAASVKRAIRQGKISNVANDASYKEAASETSAAAKSFTDYVESKTGGAKGGIGGIFKTLLDAGIRIWTPYKDRQSAERQNDAEAFYEDVKWDQWEVLTGASEPQAEGEQSKGGGDVEEIHLGDPPDGQKGAGETLTIDPAKLSEIDRYVSGESKGARVDSKLLALETLNIAKEYAGMDVSRAEPPTPTKVKAFLSLYGLPFRYADTGKFVPYCAAGVGYAAARAHYRLSRGQDVGDDYVRLGDALPDVTRDYCKTHPATKQMMSAANARTHPNGESFWVSPKQRPEQGWLVFFNWTGGHQPQHVGIVDSVVSDGRVLKTVEFNTSRDDPSNGGRVEPKTRSVRYVIGYIRTYPSTAAPHAAAMLKAALARTGTRRALLVGISDYAAGTNPDDAWGSINTGRDLENMRYVLETFYGFKSSDIRTMRNDEATQENIESEFRTHLVANAKPNDVVVFYFTGHGFQIPDDNGDELADGRDEVLVTWVPKEKQSLSKKERCRLMYMRDDSYQLLLGELSAKMRGDDGKVQRNITVIFDSCNSGSATKGSLVPKGRVWIEAIDGSEPKGGGVDLASGWLTQGRESEGITFVSGSQSNQFSYMMPESAKDGSALTYYLTAFLTSLAREPSDRGVSYDDLHRWVSVKVSALHATQNSQIEGNVSAAILGDGKPLVTHRLASVRRVLNTPLRLELNEGSLHGVTIGSRFDVYKRNTDVANPANRLAQIEITAVDATTSIAKITNTATPAPKPDDYEAGQAVVTDYRFDGQPLRVLVATGIPTDKAKALSGAVARLQFITRDGVTDANFDVKLGWKNGLSYQRADGATLPFGAAVDAKALQERLP